MLSNYPDGVSDYTEGAPWNIPEVPEKDFDITCCQTLSKTVTITTTNYISGASGVDYEPDGEGGYSAEGWQDPDDTSDTNWTNEYEESSHFTPLELIQKFKAFLEVELQELNAHLAEKHSPIKKMEKSFVEHLIAECDGWTDVETEICE